MSISQINPVANQIPSEAAPSASIPPLDPVAWKKAVRPAIEEAIKPAFESLLQQQEAGKMSVLARVYNFAGGKMSQRVASEVASFIECEQAGAEHQWDVGVYSGSSGWYVQISAEFDIDC